MAKTKIKVVVDASVARAAGDVTLHPTSVNCRDALNALASGNYVILFSPTLKDEWKKHQSRYSRTWLVSMIARRRFELLSSLPPNENLRMCIHHHAPTTNCALAMAKDLHLLDTALIGGRRVLALDEIVRDLFRAISTHHKPIQDVMWANPILPQDQAVLWINSGAPKSKRLFLRQ